MDTLSDRNRSLIRFTDIMKYIGTGVRPYEEGERVFLANHIFCVGITKEILNETHVFALCLQSTTPSESIPYEINVEVKRVGCEVHIKCHCQCPVGIHGKCKHCVGVLYYLQAIRLCDIDEASCTDVKQQWGRLKKNASSMYEVIPVSKFCHFNEKSEKIIPNYDPNKKVDFIEVLTRGFDPNTTNVELVKVKAAYRSSIYESVETSNKINIEEIAKEILSKDIYPCLDEDFIFYECTTDGSLLTFSMLQDHEKKFYNEKVKVDLQSAITICKNTELQSNESWIYERKLRITASKAYQLYTYVENKNQDWNNKIRGYVMNSFKGNRDTRYGLLCEERAIKSYERMTDFQVVRLGLLVNPAVPWLGCSLDGLVVNKHTLEIKSIQAGKTMTASAAAQQTSFLNIDKEGKITLKEKHAYYCQVQLGMFITGLEVCHFVVYSSFDDSCFMTEIYFDSDKVFNEYIPKLQFVYFSHLLRFLSDPINNIFCDENMNKNNAILISDK